MLSFPIPGELPDPGIEFMSLVSLALIGRFFRPVLPRKPLIYLGHILASVISSSCIDPFIIIQCSSLCFLMNFPLKTILPYISIVTCPFLSFSFEFSIYLVV